MMIYELPTCLEVNNKSWEIRTDFRDVLKILIAFEDPELENNEKQYICLFILFVDFESIPQNEYADFYKAAIKFIDNGAESNEHSPRTMDWEQDASLLFPAVNRVAGYEVRAVEYLHWWTFTGYFMEIKDSIFATVLNLRQKKAKGKKLEKWEREFWQTNKNICVLKTKLTEEEQAEKDRLNAILG